MANKYLTMLDLAKRTGGSAVVGLIEENANVAPEFNIVPVRSIAGTTFRTNVRKSLPATQFRNVNEGTETVKSEYAQELSQTFVIDDQLEVDTAVVEAEDPEGRPGILADEASGVMQSVMLHVGSQFYYGTANDTKGFQGVENFVDSSMIVDAGGTSASTGSSVYGVSFGRQGVNFIAGNKSSLRLGRWQKQQITRSSKKLMAWVNNLQGWIGLTFGHVKSVGRIKDCTEDSGKGFTDLLTGKLLEKFPTGMTPDVLFCTRRSRRQLHESRYATSNASTTGIGTVSAPPLPSESLGVRLVTTDSLVDTEALT